MSGELKVAVCVPSRGAWSSRTATSIARMMRHFTAGEAGEIDVVSVTGFLVPEQRSKCVAEAWAMEATHLLWVDSDIGFPEDALLRLLRHDKPVVAVNYPRTALPPVPTAYVDDEAETGPLYSDGSDTGLRRVKHCGFGLMLCDMAVFDALAGDLPLFHFETTPPHHLTWCTEDVYFCRKLNRHNIPLYIDQDLSQQIVHVGEVPFTNAMAVTARDETRRLAEAEQESE